MKALPRIAIVVVLAAGLAAVVYVKRNADSAPAASSGTTVATTENAAPQEPPAPADDAASSTTEEPAEQSLPRLVDLGADKCVPCKMMAPVLEELKKEYAGRMNVVFIDVWKNPDAGDAYGIQMIPTQIFYDGAGKELFRHTGFFSKEDILAKWKELGFDFGASDKP